MKNNSWICPKCAKDNNIVVDICLEDEYAFVDLLCENCGTSWTDVFGLRYNGYSYSKQHNTSETEVKE